MRGSFIRHRKTKEAREKTKSGQGAVNNVEQTAKKEKVWKFYDQLAEIFEKNEQQPRETRDFYDFQTSTNIIEEEPLINENSNHILLPHNVEVQLASTSTSQPKDVSPTQSDPSLLNRYYVPTDDLEFENFSNYNFDSEFDRVILSPIHSTSIESRPMIENVNNTNQICAEINQPLPRATAPQKSSGFKKRRTANNEESSLIADAQRILKDTNSCVNHDYVNYGKALGSLLEQVNPDDRLRVFKACCDICYDYVL